MAAAVACRKRSALPFLDDVIPEPPHLAKRTRLYQSPAPAGVAAQQQQPPLAAFAFDPLDALLRVFPDADPAEVESCFAASGRNVHKTVEAFRARQRLAREREAASARVATAAARDGGMEECAGVLVEQMSSAADVEDARSRASWILKLIEGAIAQRAAAAEAPLREENAAIKARAEELERDKRDN